MKFIGAGLLWLAFLISGMIFSKRYSRRCLIFDELVIMCSGIHNRIFYIMQPLDEIIIDISQEGICRSLTFIDYFQKSLYREDFPSAWKNAVNSSNLPLTDKEKNIIKSFGLSLGKSDGEVQLNIIGYYTELFKVYAKEARLKKEKYEKASLLGWCLCGSALLILFL